METDKAIQLLSDSCDRGMMTYNADYRDAVRMGRDALIWINRVTVGRWDGKAAGVIPELDRLQASGVLGPAPVLCCDNPECGGYVRSTKCIKCGHSCQECRVLMPAPGGE